ncbi:MAG: Ig domain-containing protein [Bacillus sp. (in: firmicutes)]
MATYNVYRNGTKVKGDLTAPTFTDTGLTPNTSYSYQVSAVNDVGESALSEPLSVKTPYSAPTGVSVNKATTTITTGGNETLTATVAPATANQGVTWESSATANATVDANGKVTAVKAGSATITAKSKADSTKSASCTVTINDPVVAVTGVTLDKTTATVEAGKTVQLTATVAPANATNKAVTYSTSDAAKATVTNAGLVTGVAAGEATITVKTTDGNKTATCVVTVTAAAGA